MVLYLLYQSPYKRPVSSGLARHVDVAHVEELWEYVGPVLGLPSVRPSVKDGFKRVQVVPNALVVVRMNMYMYIWTHICIYVDICICIWSCLYLCFGECNDVLVGRIM